MAFTTVGVASSLMVWDIFTAQHKIEAVLRNSLSALSEVGAFAVQVAVEAAVTSAVAEVELGVFIVSLAGLVAGVAAPAFFSSPQVGSTLTSDHHRQQAGASSNRPHVPHRYRYSGRQ